MQELLRCARCKIARYCSKDCQVWCRAVAVPGTGGLPATLLCCLTQQATASHLLLPAPPMAMCRWPTGRPTSWCAAQPRPEAWMALNLDSTSALRPSRASCPLRPVACARRPRPTLACPGTACKIGRAHV